MGLRDTTTGLAGDQQAVIDIGSNTVRLVIYGGPARAPVVLLNEKVSARLGKGVAENGKLSDKAMNAALVALGRYAAMLRARGINRVHTVEVEDQVTKRRDRPTTKPRKAKLDSKSR